MRLLHVMYCVFNFAQKHKSKYHCLPFYLVTLFIIDTLKLVKHEGASVCWNFTLLMSCTLDLSSVITCKKATTSGIFSIGVGYCVYNTAWFYFELTRYCSKHHTVIVTKYVALVDFLFILFIMCAEDQLSSHMR